MPAREDLGFLRRGRLVGRGDHVVRQAVAGQAQAVDRVHHVLGIERGVLPAGLHVGQRELHGPRHTRGKVGARAVGELQILAVAAGIGLGIVVLDEAARAAHEVQPHQLAPVVGVGALLDGGDRLEPALVPADELGLAQLPQQALGPDAEVRILFDEESKLVRQVEVGLVVRRRRQQHDTAFVLAQVLLDGAVALAFAVAQVVAFVDHHEPVAPQLRELADHAAGGQHAAAEAVALAVVLPHAHEVLGAEDERLEVLVILEDAGQRRGHKRLAEADHVADQHAAAAVQVVRGDLHGGHLELEQLAAEVARDAELGQPGPRLLREVVGDLQVDVIRRNRLLPCPAPVDDLDQLIRDVDAKPVRPARVEPVRQFLAGVLIDHVDIQFALLGQSGEREVATAEIAHRGTDRIGPEQEVELGVQRMTQEQLDDDLPRPELRGQTPQARLVFIGRRADGQLLAELRSQLLLQPDRRLVVDRAFASEQTHGRAELLLRRPLHPDQQPTALPLPAGPPLDAGVELLPAAEVEVPDAEVGALGDVQRLLQGRQERLIDVVEDPRHRLTLLHRPARGRHRAGESRRTAPASPVATGASGIFSLGGRGPDCE